jgi:hypothetical protein
MEKMADRNHQMKDMGLSIERFYCNYKKVDIYIPMPLLSSSDSAPHCVHMFYKNVMNNQQHIKFEPTLLKISRAWDI